MSDRILLEEHGPLSRSLIWQVERAAYRAQGIDGWRVGMVPHYVTTNPFIAGSYASVLLAFLRDCDQLPGFDAAEPVHIIELGAGPGRFGYHLLTQLLAGRDRTRLAHLPIRYVLSDLAEDNVAFWQGHPKLAPLVDAGVLDFARFDVEHDEELHLLVSGETLGPGALHNPGVVIANYIFDSVPQDCFRIEGNRMVALLAAATSSHPEPDLADPMLLERIELNFTEAEIEAGPLELDPASMAVLDGYRERLGDTMVLWPSTTIRCLDRLRHVWADRMVLLSGDKGFSREDDLLSRGQPDVVQHGSVFSLMVNFHAIGEWVTRQEGFVLHPAQRHTSLNISLCALGLDRSELIETAATYHGSIEALSPDDFFNVVLMRDYPETDIDRFLALLRLSRWDADVLMRHLPGIGDALGDASMETKEEVAWSVRQVWNAYFPIGEVVDVPFYLGMVFHELGWYAEAIEFLEHSLELYGPAGETYYNMALCHHAARDLERAKAFAEVAGTYPESADRAKALHLRIGAEIDRLPFGARSQPKAAPAELTAESEPKAKPQPKAKRRPAAKSKAAAGKNKPA